MLWNDLRYALRLMRRNPGFSFVAVLSLALGIGANTAIFSLFYTIMLRQLPVPHPEELVELVRNTPEDRHWAGYWGWEKYAYLRDHTRLFTGLTGMGFDNIASVRTEGSDPDTLILENVPGNYFAVLGLKPAIGRFSGPEDVPARGDGNVAVVSWSYWNRRFHRDPAILGTRIWYNDSPKTVIGVAPPGYVGPRVGSRTDLWIPVGPPFGVTILARMRPGVTIAQAQAEIDVVYRDMLEQASDRRSPRGESRMELLPAGAGLVWMRDRFGKPLALLLAVVGLLLLLACINMAGMLLARGAARQREMAVRVGLGASRGRLMRQMLTESLLLSGAGTLVSILVARVVTGALVRIMASGRVFEHVEIEVPQDLPLLLFTGGIAVLTGILFGLAPAWYAFRSAPASPLRQTGNGGDTWFWRLFGKCLVAAEVALSILLVTAAVVFLGHLGRMRNFDLGFRSDHVLLVQLDPSRSGYSGAQLSQPYRQLLARFEAIPGVRSATIGICAPMQGCGIGARYVTAEGFVERRENRKMTPITYVAPRYFETLGVTFLGGRDFSFRDAGGPRVAIVNEAMARRYFPGRNPLGKHFTIEHDARDGERFGPDRTYEIIGLVGNAKVDGPRDAPWPTIYFDMFQENRLFDHFALRTSVAPESVANAARSAVHEVLSAVPVRRVMTLSDQVDAAIVPERLIATLSECFGALGAALAGVGLYGLLAFTVARRTNEIGVRMALGATSGGIVRMVARDAVQMVAAGLALGISMVLWTRPLAGKLVEDLRMTAAPLVLGSAAAVLLAVVASYLPARRAVGVDPIEALRHE